MLLAVTSTPSLRYSHVTTTSKGLVATILAVNDVEFKVIMLLHHKGVSNHVSCSNTNALFRVIMLLQYLKG